MNELIDKLKTQIIEALNLEDMTISDIDTEAPLSAPVSVWTQ